MEHTDRVVLSLYRHGITEANQKKIYIGWTDVPVAEEGKERLAQTRTFRPEADRVIASDLKRCTESAEQLFPGQPALLNSGFREINFGAWEGKTANELMDRSDFSQWLNDPDNMQPENGESFEDFSKRVLNAWYTTREWCYQDEITTIAIITHGGPIRRLLMELAPEQKSFWDWKPLHGQGITLIWNDREAFRRGERCTQLSAVPITANSAGFTNN